MQTGMHCYGANGKILIIKRFREQDPEAFSLSPHTMNIKRTHSAVILYFVKQTYKTFHTLTADWITGRQLPPIISLHLRVQVFLCAVKCTGMVMIRVGDSDHHRRYN